MLVLKCRCDYCGREQWIKKPTNGDLIRAMCNEDLATFLSEEPWTQPANWIEWLRQEVE